MKVQIVASNGQLYTITTCNMKLLGDWAAEQLQRLMSADCRMQDSRIEIWPTEEDEFRMFRQVGPAPLMVRADQDGLLHLANIILKASSELADIEEGQRAKT